MKNSLPAPPRGTRSPSSLSKISPDMVFGTAMTFLGTVGGYACGHWVGALIGALLVAAIAASELRH